MAKAKAKAPPALEASALAVVSVYRDFDCEENSVVEAYGPFDQGEAQDKMERVIAAVIDGIVAELSEPEEQQVVRENIPAEETRTDTKWAWQSDVYGTGEYSVSIVEMTR